MLSVAVLFYSRSLCKGLKCRSFRYNLPESFVTYFINYLFIVDKQEQCNTDDSQCIDASTSSFVTSYIASSSSFDSMPYATFPVVLTDTLSDFHEAKVAQPRQGLQKPDKVPSLSPTDDNIGSIQDKYNENQESDSHSHGSSDSLEETSSSVGLSRVEAGVVSVCGILVVAGIAVGIFVWKNTVRRRSLRDQGDMADLENYIDPDNHHDNSNNPIIVNGALSLKENRDRQQKKIQRFNQQENNTAPFNTSGETMMKPAQEQDQPESQAIGMQELSKDPIILDKTSPALELSSNNHILAKDADKQQPNTSTTVTIEQVQTELTSQPNILDRKEEVTNDTLQMSDPEQAPQPHLANIAALQPHSIHDTPSYIHNTPNLLDLEKESTLAPKLDNCTNEPIFNGSPGIEGNVSTYPSALDPAFDPTALTYPLKKLMHTPRIITSSAHISVDLSRHEDDEAEGEQLNVQPRKETVKQRSDHDNIESKLPTLKLGQQLNKLFRYPDKSTLHEQEQDSNATAIVDISLVSSSDSSSNNHKEKKMIIKLKKGPMLEKLTRVPPRSSSSAQSIKEDYTDKYETEYGKPFLSPLDLPNDKYIPLRDAAGPPLMSRAQVLADPIKRLGEDEIALWEQNLKKKKEFSYEQMKKEELDDKNIYIENCFGEPSLSTT